MPIRRFARAAVVPAVVAAYVGLTPGIAAAAVTCTFFSGTASIGIDSGTAVVSRDAGAAGAIRVNGTQCGSATVATASAISVGGSGGVVQLDLGNGGLGPGATTETDGISEIHVVWNGFGIGLAVLGTAGPDYISHAANGGLHLNSDSDSDVNFNFQPASITIAAAGGDDFVDLSRPDSNGNPAWTATVLGGDGDDVLRGDTVTDTISGGPGHDRIADGLGNDDAVSGDDGDDTFYAAKAQHDVTFIGNEALPDAGSETNTIFVNSIGYAEDVEISVTITHPVTSSLTVAVATPSSFAPLVLATGRPGTGFWGTVFDDSAASPISAGSGTYTGRFTPSGDALASLLSSAVSGPWVLTVTDGAGDGNTGTLVSWSIHVVGSQFASGEFVSTATNGEDEYDGGLGTDTLRYGARTAGVRFTATSPASGTAGDAGENDTHTGVEHLVGGLGSDDFTGSSGNDSFEGGPGNDRFNGGGGDDDIDCGAVFDDDIVDYQYALAAIDVDLAAGTATGDGTDTLTSCDSVIGTPFDDVVVGTDGANTVYGGEGDDTISLGDGFDTAYPWTGQDTVALGAGQDTLVDEVAGDGSNDSFSGGADTDHVTYFAGSAQGVLLSLDGVANDGVPGEADNVADFESATTGPYADTILGSDGPNVINAVEGNDTVDGAGGDDELLGGEGVDTLSFASSPGPIDASLVTVTATGDGSDVVQQFEDIVGSAFGDALDGDEGANAIRPGAGGDSVSSFGGDDSLVAEPAPDGGDVWNPGLGSDTADYSLRTTAVSVSLDDAANDGATGEGDDIPNGVEVVRGGLGGDAIVGGLEANTFYGGLGADTLLGRGGGDTLYGDDGDDAVLGSSGNDTLHGGGGNDSVAGGEGDDRLLGGTGNDTLIGGLGDDDEFGEAGDDRFLQGDTASANGSDLLVGGANTDTVTYSGRSGGVTVDIDGQFDDGQPLEQDNVSRDIEKVEGTAHADRLAGNELANSLNGLGGNDTFVESAAASGADTYLGGSGVDIVTYAARTGAVRADLDNVADDGATGEGDNVRSDVEHLYGGAGSDVLTGSSAANRIVGGAGNDTITGSTGADYLDGGIGNDTLHAKDGVRDSVVGGSGTDRARRDTGVDAVSGVEAYF